MTPWTELPADFRSTGTTNKHGNPPKLRHLCSHLESNLQELHQISTGTELLRVFPLVNGAI